MRTQQLLFIITFCLMPFFSHSGEPFVVGETINIDSTVLGKKATIHIKLPSSYQASKQKHYPVYYNLGTDGDFVTTAGTIETLSHNQEYPMPETILVSLSTDTAINIIERGAKNEEFINFLALDVIPYVEKNFRTQPFKILVSGARFGQAPLYALMHHTELFQAYITISPWTKGASELANEFETFLKQNRELNAFLWLSSGGESRVTPHYDKLIASLERYAPARLDWKSAKFEQHNGMLQSLLSLPSALEYLFSDLVLASDSETFKAGAVSIKNYYQDISDHKYGYVISAERALSIFGNTLLRKQKVKDAIDVFQINLQDHPNSPHVYAAMANALIINNDLAAALLMQKNAYKLAAAQNSEYEDYYKQRLQKIESQLLAK